jgi:hypothetical protein
MPQQKPQLPAREPIGRVIPTVQKPVQETPTHQGDKHSHNTTESEAKPLSTSDAATGRAKIDATPSNKPGPTAKRTARKRPKAVKSKPVQTGGIHPFGSCVPQGECQCQTQ